MPDETHHDDGDTVPAEKDPKRAVNPAARHDPPAPVKPQPHHGEDEEAVPPVQEEPLDPLGPGGIGA